MFVCRREDRSNGGHIVFDGGIRREYKSIGAAYNDNTEEVREREPRCAPVVRVS